MNYSIRKAVARDIKFLPEIEKEASKLFIEYGLEAGVFADATDIEELQQALRDELLWVAQADNQLVGFAFSEIIESGLILSEVDILPSFGKQGLGTKLVKEVSRYATETGYDKLFLTTFKDIPWNYSFYKKLGFKIVDPSTFTPDISQIVEREHNNGLKKEKRVVMVYFLKTKPFTE